MAANSTDSVDWQYSNVSWRIIQNLYIIFDGDCNSLISEDKYD